MLKDINMQTRATKALQTYVEEVVLGFEKLLLTHEKLRDVALTELGDVAPLMETPLNNFGRAVKDMRHVAATTKVGLEVHLRKISSCSTALARADKAAASLQSTGVARTILQPKSSGDAILSTVQGTVAKHGRRNSWAHDKEQAVKLANDAQIQRSIARSALEACVSRKSTLIDIAQQALEAASSAMQTPLLTQVDTLSTTIQSLRSNSTISGFSDFSCDDTWNPFLADLIEQEEHASKEMLPFMSAADVSRNPLPSEQSCPVDRTHFSDVLFRPFTSEEPNPVDGIEFSDHGNNPFDVESAETEDEEPVPDENNIMPRCPTSRPTKLPCCTAQAREPRRGREAHYGQQKSVL